MKNEIQETPLREWTTPHLLRLNQADGTDKHLDITEAVTGTALTRYSCANINTGSGGVGVAGAACGPS